MAQERGATPSSVDEKMSGLIEFLYNNLQEGWFNLDSKMVEAKLEEIHDPEALFKYVTDYCLVNNIIIGVENTKALNSQPYLQQFFERIYPLFKVHRIHANQYKNILAEQRKREEDLKKQLEEEFKQHLHLSEKRSKELQTKQELKIKQLHNIIQAKDNYITILQARAESILTELRKKTAQLNAISLQYSDNQILLAYYTKELQSAIKKVETQKSELNTVNDIIGALKAEINKAKIEIARLTNLWHEEITEVDRLTPKIQLFEQQIKQSQNRITELESQLKKREDQFQERLAAFIKEKEAIAAKLENENKQLQFELRRIQQERKELTESLDIASKTNEYLTKQINALQSQLSNVFGSASVASTDSRPKSPSRRA